VSAADRTSARSLTSGAVTVADVRSAADTIEHIAGNLSSKTNESIAIDAFDGPIRPHDVLDQVVKRLSKIDKENDTGTAARIVAPCENIADRILAEALLSLAYAADIGDPDGAALLAGNVAERHDFGVALRDGEARARAAWDLPKSNVAPGTAWHISGSLLGLDVAMAPLALRRINADHVIPAPALTSNERGTFAASIALMNPFALNDADRDVIGESLRLGRARVAAMKTDTFEVIADEIGMDGWRRRAARWTLVHQDGSGDDIRSLFSMAELLRLGGAPVMALDAWGMAALTSTGCLCTRLRPLGQWTLWTGRPQLGLLATTLADLNLLIAETLHDLRLPAALARHVLAAAVQDFIDEVRPTDPDDWLTIARTAQRVTRDRVEDYVAAAAADGPLLPDANEMCFVQ